MSELDISVVLPVYNVERYLAACLDSILSQTCSNIEVICVNDGSTDGSLEVLREYERRDDRVIVIDQANAGAARARNVGIDTARGQYLAILDSDDYYEPEMLEKAFARAEETQSEIVVFRSDTYYTETGETEPYPYSIRQEILPEKTCFPPDEIKQDVFRAFIGWSWDKLFKADFINRNGLRFQEIRTSNDMYFVFAAVVRANRIAIIDEVLAHHRRGVKGLAETRDKSWECYHEALLKLKSQLQEWGLFERYERDFVNYTLHASFWNLDTLGDTARCSLQARLADGWFDEFGVTGRSREYFYHAVDYKKYRLLLKAVKPRVSIVIPSLNSAEYYRECINSAMKQTMREIEIICVDAGSDDGTVEIIRSKMNKDPRVRLIHSDMRSYGHQMNLGLDAARGEFFSILESDDYIEANTCETYYGIADENNLDFVKSDTGVVTGKGASKVVNTRRLTKCEPVYNMIWDTSKNPFLMRMYNLTQPGLYRLSFLREHDVRYHESPGASYQDNGFHIQVFAYGKRAMFVHDVCYLLRRDNPNSSVLSKGKVFAICDEYDYIRSLLKERGLDEFLPMCANRRFGNYQWTAGRIGEWHRPAFFERYAKDFKALRDAGELDRTLFSPAEWSTINSIIALGSDYYHLVWLKEEENANLRTRVKTAERKRRRAQKALDQARRGSGFSASLRRMKRKLKGFIRSSDEGGLGNAATAVHADGISNPFDSDCSDYYRIMDESDYANQVARAYARAFGGLPDMENPVFYSEKVQFRKLNGGDSPSKAAVLDKAEFRRMYAGSDIEAVLPDCLGVWDSLDAMDIASLPKAFYLSCTHANDLGIVVTDKEILENHQFRQVLEAWLSGDYSTCDTLEFEYRGITPRLMAEDIVGRDSEDQVEYAVWCFGGQARLVQVNSEVDGRSCMSFFDMDWNWMPFNYSMDFHEVKPECPEELERMVAIAQKVSTGFDHMRVRFVLHEDNLYLTNISFNPDGGYVKWSSPDADRELGDYWELKR